VLVGLDEIRQQAYLVRDPALLANVYGAPGLLAQDSATLERLIPLGCSLQGVHTAYSAVRLVPTPESVAGTPTGAGAGPGPVAITVTAVLAASTLVCPGAPAVVSAGSAPTILRIDLAVAVTGGYLIVGEQIER
jgi:hypothetical protein